jgi:hypothetical protein
MKPEQQRIAIAQACGWKLTETAVTYPNGLVIGFHPPEYVREVFLKACPDYLNDLNAMHEAEEVLSAGQINTYLGHLYKFGKVAAADSNPWEIIVARVAVHAPAAQRAEAFLRTLNLWTP